MNNGQKVRDWLNSLPGMVEADTPEECIRKAWGTFGGPCSVDELKQALKREGFKVEKVGPRYQLALPGELRQIRR